MKTAWFHFLANCPRSFYHILALTIGLTCAMFVLLWIKPESPGYQGSCAGQPKIKRPADKQLLFGPGMLYAVHPSVN